ncbi:MAG: LytTR family transcriptional regulator [Caulobacteraceae bacterium]|nr:LytTR family transcriptional regulator [Caulobacteraceae bacterium]
MIAFAGLGLAYMVVNATSVIDERSMLGQPLDPWRPWVWEATSYLAWLALVPAVIWLSARAMELTRLWLTLAFHIVCAVAVSLAHSGLLYALRATAYLAVGETYQLGQPLVAFLIYELRKDATTYASIVIVWLLLTHFIARSITLPPTEHTQPPRFEIRDGSRIRWLQLTDIDWVGAAGNYVELHGRFGAELVRRTLSDVEAELVNHGFVRIHRSRLVRTEAVSGIETRQSGDFDLVMVSGVKLAGSRRFRSRLT